MFGITIYHACSTAKALGELHNGFNDYPHGISVAGRVFSSDFVCSSDDIETGSMYTLHAQAATQGSSTDYGWSEWRVEATCGPVRRLPYSCYAAWRTPFAHCAVR
jgi:hypothetical protein